MTRVRLRHLLLAAAFALGACSGGGDDDAVATLDPSSTSTTADPGDDRDGAPSGDSQSHDDALVAFMDCLRDEGIDAPDPEPNEEGELRLPLNNSYADDPDYPAAEETCGHFLEDVIGPEPSPEEILEREDRALACAQCMREQGGDIPDPGPGGQGFVVLEDSQGRTIDPDDPEVAAASDACSEAALEADP